MSGQTTCMDAPGRERWARQIRANKTRRNLFPRRCDNRTMRFAFIRAAVLACVCAMAGLAQQLTVDKVVEFVTSSITQKLQDKQVASYLTNVKLTQRLAPRTIEELQSK